MTSQRHRFDVAVVGAGHAGVEAAAAAARIGARVALISGNLDTIAKMSCNPAIGGVAKGQVVREIDALGGVMARAADATGIHWRILGRGKGPAMWSPRAQCDKPAYAQWVKEYVEGLSGVFPLQGDCVDLLIDEQGRVTGVRLRDGRDIQAAATVVTTGTFLRGLLHQGEAQVAGGRMGDGPGLGLSDTFQRLGLRLGRMKTGTPMRLHADSIDWSLCEAQPGDEAPRAFAFETHAATVRNAVHCWICHTTAEAHAAITDNLHRAPMYNGQIDSVGPRYCPSIEDKVVRFAHRDRHQLFLEPEGVRTREVYVNGLSTSLPVAVQDQILSAIPALSQAHVLRYGYAVEYDVVDPSQLDHSLRVRSVPGLYLAGQINGTSGYEEAAMQGLLAGANAALELAGREALILSRADAYGGVMVDDLVAGGLDEPYRLFTSRAEHRLSLRADNADRRLVPLARRCGLVDEARAEAVAAKAEAIHAAVAATPPAARKRISGEGLDLEQAMEIAPHLVALPPVVAEGTWIELRYAAYLEREAVRIQRLQQLRDLTLPSQLQWSEVPGLSNEGRSRLQRGAPRTLGEAEALPGVTPGDIETLWAWLQSGRSSGQAQQR
ncbi:MAG: tRNA uridine-5-carboxymethylaminomethyl(34) synthesis enzyme MnmG [Planctomycetota bacterium]|nr:MAG: tRNA uridine-5-carboxymethylaminomethyl(34) synthesis enzyme MnmG [Planctomycetota bacterium]